MTLDELIERCVQLKKEVPGNSPVSCRDLNGEMEDQVGINWYRYPLDGSIFIEIDFDAMDQRDREKA